MKHFQQQKLPKIKQCDATGKTLTYPVPLHAQWLATHMNYWDTHIRNRVGSEFRDYSTNQNLYCWSIFDICRPFPIPEHGIITGNIMHAQNCELVQISRLGVILSVRGVDKITLLELHVMRVYLAFWLILARNPGYKLATNAHSLR